MNRIFQWLILAAVVVSVSSCGTTYLGKVDVMGIGIGPQTTNTDDSQYVDEAQLKNVMVAYTPGIEIIEQEVSDTTKFIAGEALVKEYQGEPAFLSAWMNEAQGVVNVALLIDKNGVIAWDGTIKRPEVANAYGKDGYSMFGGAKRLTLEEAMKKYVGDEEEQDFEEDKELKFEKGFFDYGKEGPFVYTKLPADFKVTKANGEVVDVTEIINNGKPTLLVFFMSKGKEKMDLVDVVDTAASVADMLSGGEGRTRSAQPQTVLVNLDATFLPAK